MNESRPRRIALSTLLLSVTLFAVCFAFWLERTRPPQILYLHIYSNRYDIYSMGEVPTAPRDWQCLATLSFVSGAAMYADIPCHYEPQMNVAGKATRRGNTVESDFRITVSDVGPTYSHEQDTPAKLDAIYDFGDGDFKFSISTSQEASAISLK